MDDYSKQPATPEVLNKAIIPLVGAIDKLAPSGAVTILILVNPEGYFAASSNMAGDLIAGVRRIARFLEEYADGVEAGECQVHTVPTAGSGDAPTSGRTTTEESLS